MRTLTRLSRVAALPLAATLLVACGGGDSGGSAEGGDSSASASPSEDSGNDSETEAYCSDLEEAQQSFAAFDSGSPDPDQLQQAFETFKTLADAAPEAVASDWQVIAGAVTTVEDSLAEIGLEISDLAALQQGQVPEGVTPEQLQGVAQQLQSLAGTEFAQAGEQIEQHAQDACGIDLSPSSGASPSDGASDEASPSESPSS